jgi:hypothetical protein
MLNLDVVPFVAFLMAQENAVLRAGGVRIRLFQEIRQLGCFAEGRFDEEDVIDIGPFGTRRGRSVLRPERRGRREPEELENKDSNE